jgi:hypothetical protein
MRRKVEDTLQTSTGGQKDLVNWKDEKSSKIVVSLSDDESSLQIKPLLISKPFHQESTEAS